MKKKAPALETHRRSRTAQAHSPYRALSSGLGLDPLYSKHLHQPFACSSPQRFLCRWLLGFGLDLLVITASLLFFIRCFSPMFELQGRTSFELLVLEGSTLIALLGLPLCALLLLGIIAVYLAIFWCFTAGSFGKYLQKLTFPKN